MRSYEHLKEKALELRKRRHLTLLQIAERLSLPKSTVYYWIKSIPVRKSEEFVARRRTAAYKAGAAMSRKWARIRESYYQSAAANAQRLLRNPSMRDFIVVYLTEGYRRDRNVVQVSNSNPGIVELADRWIRLLSRKCPKYWVQIHADNDESSIKSFWARLLHVAANQIKVSRKSNSGNLSGRTWRSEHGVMMVRVCSTELRARIAAWMDYVQNQWKHDRH